MRNHQASAFIVLTFATQIVISAAGWAAESRWEAAIRAFEAQDAKQAPAKNGILFVGSSSIRKWDLKKWL